jgi:hypothetical protein
MSLTWAIPVTVSSSLMLLSKAADRSRATHVVGRSLQRCRCYWYNWVMLFHLRARNSWLQAVDTRPQNRSNHGWRSIRAQKCSTRSTHSTSHHAHIGIGDGREGAWHLPHHNCCFPAKDISIERPRSDTSYLCVPQPFNSLQRYTVCVTCVTCKTEISYVYI